MSGRSLQSPASQYHELSSGPDLLRFSNGEDPWDSNSEFPPVSQSSVGYSPASDQGRPRWNAGPSSKSAIGISQRRLGRTGPNASPRSLPASAGRRSSFHDPQPYGHLRLSTIRSIEQPGPDITGRGSVDLGSPRPESAVSSAAPSAMWDELDEMKSRILKLELTGKLAPSSQDALSWTPERPRTSGTTATPSSSSPKHRRKASNLSRTTTAASPIQTSLQSALAGGKHVLGNDVYKSLEATVADALALSAMSSGNPSGGVMTVNSKDTKGNADSLCRNLTALCLSLSEERIERQRSNRDEDSPTLVQVGESPTAPSQRRGGRPQEGNSRRSSVTRGDSFKSSRTRNSANDGPPVSYSNSRRNYSPEPQSPASRLSTPSRVKRPTWLVSEGQNLHRRSNSTAMTDSNASKSAYRVSRQSSSYDSEAQSVAASQPSPMSPSLQQPKHAMSHRTSLSQPGTPSRKSLIATTPRTPPTPHSGTQTVFHTPRYISSETDDSPPAGSVPREKQPESKLPAPSSRLGMSYTPQYSRT